MCARSISALIISFICETKVSVHTRTPTNKMSAIGDKIDDIEDKIFEEGGYPALWKFKAWKAYEAVKSGDLCK